MNQPIEEAHASSGSLFCWNGEAWKINGDAAVGHDAESVFHLLLQSTQIDCDANQPQAYELTLQRVLSVMSSVSGPYAFVFYDARNERIFFGRDSLGRRSLVMRQQPGELLQICSVCDQADLQDWAEIEADGIYVYQIASCTSHDPTKLHLNGTSARMELLHIPWTKPDLHSDGHYALISPFPQLNKATNRPDGVHLNTDSRPVDKMAQILHESLKLRTTTLYNSGHASDRIAILFSGGIDCTLIARMIHNIIPHDQDVDLLNVAFENPRVIRAAAKNSDTKPLTGSIYSECPDRITGLRSFSELRAVCPGRAWNFVSIDVPYTETLVHRSQIISLIYPHNTEMDLSIGCALYFAARGEGTMRDVSTDRILPYKTPARVLMSGLGADELFGGYTRHATAFKRQGHGGLVKELELDFDRLGKRNLGRDDRVISHWGREARYPYLDEDFVSWALSIPVWEKCGFGQDSIPEGHPDTALEPGKQLLRLLAWKLGLRGAATEKKRAIQFGARTAKMEAGRTKGTQILS